MPTVIDELIVVLGLDPGQFTRGQKDAVDAARKTQEELESRAKKIEDTSKRTTGFFREMRGSLIELYAVFTAGRGIRDFIHDTIQVTANLGLMGRTMDLSAQELAQWRGAAQQMGGSADDMQGSIYSLTQSLQQFTLTGESAVVPYFRALGISLVDNSGKLKTATQLYTEAAQRIEGMDPARATALLTGLGASPSMINFLLQGGRAVQRQLEAQKKFAPTAEDVRQAQAFRRSWVEIEQASTTAGRTILTALAPALLTALHAVSAFFEFLRTHKAVMYAFFAGLTALVLALSTALAVDFVTSAGKAVATGFVFLIRPIAWLIGAGLPRLLIGLGTLTAEALPALSEAFYALGVAILTMPVGWLMAGIAAVAGGAYLIYRNWDGIKSWWHRLWGGAADDAESASARINRAMNKQLGLPSSGASRGPQRGVSGPRLVTRSGQSVLDHLGVTSSAGNLADLISRGEGNYDSVHARGRAGTADLEHMTVSQVLAAQRAGRFGAAGRYQAVHDTLAMAARGLGLSGNEHFDRGLQDRIFGWLINSKRPAIGAYISGKSNDLYAALKAAAEEWASIADPDTGLSHYAGIAGNRASITAAEMARALRGARQAAISVPRAGVRLASSQSYSRTSHTQIGTMNIVTQATDSRGIARGIGSAIQDNAFGMQANYGAA